MNACKVAISHHTTIRMRPMEHPWNIEKKKAPDVGLEPTTLGLRVPCSTDWANRAATIQCLKRGYFWHFSMNNQDPSCLVCTHRAIHDRNSVIKVQFSWPSISYSTNFHLMLLLARTNCLYLTYQLVQVVFISQVTFFNFPLVARPSTFQWPIIQPSTTECLYCHNKTVTEQKTPDVELKPLTPGLKVPCSTD